MGNVQIKQDFSERSGENGQRLIIRRRHFYQDRVAVVILNTPQRLVSGIKNQVPGTGQFIDDFFSACFDINFHQVPVIVVVFGYVNLFILRVIRQMRGIIEIRRIKGGQFATFSRSDIYFRNLRNDPGIVDGCIDLSGNWIVFRFGNISQRMGGYGLKCCQRILADTFYGPVLEIIFPSGPLFPYLCNRPTVHFSKLPGIEGF